ncbi:MAG: hypothetical protein J5950_10725 [Clostridia bacterium]|nr:hypothetical protein [Clostridia bacterium]
MKKLLSVLLIIALALTMLSVSAEGSEVVAVFPEGSGDGGPQQINSGSIAVVITVPEGYFMYEIIGLNSPTWTQKEGCDAMVEVYRWNDDYDEAISGEVIATGEVYEHQDNMDAVFTLNNDVPAGKYLAEFSAIGSGSFGFWSFGEADGDATVFQRGTEVTFYPKLAIRIVPEGGEREPVEPESIVRSSKYKYSYTVDAGNAVSWTGASIGDVEVKYYLKADDDGLYVGVVAKGANEGDLIQLNFNPDNKLAATPGLFISFKLGDTITVLQHNHKTGVLDNDSAGGADISDKVETQVVKMSYGYEFTAKLPVGLFTVTDVEGADSFEFGSDPLYFGMFMVVGGQGFTNQSAAPGSDWTCNGLCLTEYSIINPKKDKSVFYLYDADGSLTTGWWLHPLTEGAAIWVDFTTDVWFNGINFYAYGSPQEYPLIISIENENEDEVANATVTCKDNKSYTVDFDKALAPGGYRINFIAGDVDDLEEDTWFVLGSAPASEKIDTVEVTGGGTNGDTQEAPFISLKVTEADPNATEKPTTVPATEPPATEKPADPTAVPATDKPTDKPADETPAPPDSTEATKDNTKTGSKNVGLIIGIIAAAAVIVAAVIAIIVSAKKKKK